MAKEERGKGDVAREREAGDLVLVRIVKLRLVDGGKEEEEEERESERVVKEEKLEKVATAIVASPPISASSSYSEKCESGRHALS